VSADSVYGAFCDYLLVGLAFGHLHCLVEVAAPGSYRGAGALAAQLQDPARQRYLLTYFSLTTLTSLGYGDILPASDPSRGLAVVEAVLGQFYVAVLIAELVGKKGAQASPGPPG
jgi:hypothetical protein